MGDAFSVPFILSWYLIATGGKRVGMLGRLRKNLTVGAANTVKVAYSSDF